MSESSSLKMNMNWYILHATEQSANNLDDQAVLNRNELLWSILKHTIRRLWPLSNAQLTVQRSIVKWSTSFM